MTEPNLYHLRYFISAAQLGSVAAAAKAHNISQPAISQGIRKLEDSLECSLLVHTKNRFKLTEEGKLLVARSGELFNTLLSIKSELKGSQKEISGPLTIASADSLVMSFLPKSLSKLRQKHPLISVEMNFKNVSEIVADVKSGKTELGILVDDGKVQGVHKELLHEGAFSFICAKGLRPILKDSQFLVTQEAPGEIELQKIFKKKFGKVAAIAMKVESWEVIAKLCSLGMGVGFVPDMMLNHWDNIRSLDESKDIAGTQKYRVLLIHRGSHQLSRQARAYLELLK